MRRLLNHSAGWVFSVALSVFFISLWGRAVVVDTDALAEAASPLGASQLVEDRFSRWLEAELVAAGFERDGADLAAAEVLASSAVDDALSQLVAEVVAAAAAGGSAGSSVDVAAAMEPSVPEITAALRTAGLDVSRTEVDSVVEDLDPLVINEPGERPRIGPESELASRLGIATVLAALVLLTVGAYLLTTSDDKSAEARRLLERIALGGLSFAVLLRIGSWVVDPGGGRAPVSEAASSVLGGHWTEPLIVGATAAAAVVATWYGKRRRPESKPLDREPKPEIDLAA